MYSHGKEPSHVGNIPLRSFCSLGLCAELGTYTRFLHMPIYTCIIHEYRNQNIPLIIQILFCCCLVSTETKRTATQSKESTIFYSSNNETVGSNPRSLRGCMCAFLLYLLCVGSDLRMSRSPVQAGLANV